jgi:hypothetical protein
MAVTADNGLAWLCVTKLRPHHVDDTLTLRVEVIKGYTEL